MLFFRADTDKLRTDYTHHLKNTYAGIARTPVWLVGGGPSFTKEQADHIIRSRATICTMNFSGRGANGLPPFLWPHIWVAFDPSPRFLPSLFLDPNIKKFLLGGRQMDLIPETGQKICDAPNSYFVDIEYRPYSRFIDPNSNAQINCADTMCMAITILYSLGFRRIYCAGTDMRIRLSEQQIDLAKQHGVEFIDDDGTFIFDGDEGTSQKRACDLVSKLTFLLMRKGMAGNRSDVAEMLGKVDKREKQYSFPQQKCFMDVARADEHYWKVVQFLRLARKNLSINGLELVSCTEGSRLNAFFPYKKIEEVAEELYREAVDPINETTDGRYHDSPDPNENLPFHVDFPSNGWEKIHKLEEKRRNRCQCREEKKEIESPEPQEKNIDLDGEVGKNRQKIIERFKVLEGQPREEAVEIDEQG